jgi:hypothetical protein
MLHSKLPLKLKNYVWLVNQDRVHNADNLKRKKWKGNEICQLCNKDENVNHSCGL